MMMRRILSLTLLLLILGSGLAAQDGFGRAGDLSILYAGPVRSQRADNWVGLLRRSFRQVDAIALRELTPEVASSYDVVVADAPWEGFGRRDRREQPNVDRDFGRPLVLIGGAAHLVPWSKVGPRRRWASGHEFAINARPDHPIFQGPLKPAIIPVEREIPSHVNQLGPAPFRPDSLPCWRVQQELDSPGVFAELHNFEDSPDAEFIAAGLASHGFFGVAIARQANLLLWGFAGDPAKMTPSAQRVFLNAVAYMKNFEDQRALVLRHAPGRSRAFEYACHLGDTRPSGLGLRYMRHVFGPVICYETHLVRKSMVASLIENQEYLYSDGAFLDIDEDLRRLKISNRTPEFLDHIERMLTYDPLDPTTQRLVRRYIDPEGRTTADSFRAWRRDSSPFFSDVGGYRWRAMPASTKTPAVEDR